MNKPTLLLLMIFTLMMTACGGNASNAAGPDGTSPGGTSAGTLSAPMQVAIGTIKLDGTDSAVTAEQAAQLLPLWQTLQVLYGSDTAAAQEIEALTAQIQETMTAKQTQAITALNLTRQDMMSIMQSQGTAAGGAQGDSAQTATTGGGGFGPGRDEFAGGLPPDGAMPGGGPGFQSQRPNTQSSDSSETGTNPVAPDPNRIPTPLVQAVIEYLKEKAGS